MGLDTEGMELDSIDVMIDNSTLLNNLAKEVEEVLLALFYGVDFFVVHITWDFM